MNNLIDYKTIGTRLASLRKKQGLTQEKLAEQLNLTSFYISKIENGKANVTLETLADICRFFNTDIGSILSGTVSQDSKSSIPPRLQEIYTNCSSSKKQLILDIAETIYKAKI